MPCYLVESEGPDGIGCQLHCVQQSDLDEAVGLGAARRPVLVALHLRGRKRGEGRRRGEAEGSRCDKRLGGRQRTTLCVHFVTGAHVLDK